MSNVTNTAKSTITTLLGTINTAANVTTSLLNSTNIIALDLQERTQGWASTSRIERKLDLADSTEVALENHAMTRVSRIEERQTWFVQNPHREEAFNAALAQARELLATA